MEKTLKLTWSDVVKWLVLIVGIATTYGMMQHKILTLEEGRETNARNIQNLEERLRAQEYEVAKISEKLESIGDDVKTIKDAIVNDRFNPGRN